MMRRIAGNGTRHRLVPLFLAVLLAGLALPASAVHAATTWHVTSCADSGATTLRGRIGAAAAGDTIVFDQNCTITLTTGTLTMTKHVTIDGTGHTVIVDGGCTGCDIGGIPSGGVTIFAVQSGIAASLTGLTIQHGNASQQCDISGTQYTCGGGIANNGGTLTLTRSTVTANNAVGGIGGGIANLGTVTLTSSTVTGSSAFFGGGIANNGTATITDSSLSGSIADTGGGIANLGTATVTHTTLSGNSANHGGGIYNVRTLSTAT